MSNEMPIGLKFSILGNQLALGKCQNWVEIEPSASYFFHKKIFVQFCLISLFSSKYFVKDCLSEQMFIYNSSY